MPQITKLLSSRLLILALVISLSSCYTKKLITTDDNSNCLSKANHRISNATYNTKIDFYNKHLSGLLLFKAISDTDSRVVFVTEVGFKIFDFEFKPDSFNVLYCLPLLRKKSILNLFKKDIGQLVQTDIGLPVSSYRKDSTITFTFARGNNRYEDYTVDAKCGQLNGIERGGRLVKKVSARITGIKKGNFDEINIRHRLLKLNIYLKQIER